MSISNRKPGTPKEAPAEPLKRAVSGAMKAIARKPEMEIVFAADKPSLVGERARLPEPPRKLTAQDVAILRGHADSMALRLACHDASIHRRAAPEGDAARAVFDAVEQARVEAIGAKRMDGVAGNLAAMLEDRYHRGNFHEITERSEAPLEDAVSLIVREKLTGQKPPASAERIVDLWRDWIEEKASADFGKLADTLGDQKRFASAVRSLLASLEMADELGSGDEDENDDQGDSSEDSGSEQENASDQADQADSDASEESETTGDESEAGETETTEAGAEDDSDG